MATSHKTVVITGASSGIGAACAAELHRLGWRVFAGVRSDAAAEKIAAQGSDRLTPLRIDVTKPETIADAERIVAEAVGPRGLDGLVNNAGIAVPGPVELIPLDAWRQQLEVNVLGVVATTQAFLPLLRPSRGRIVNISSVSGGQSSPFLGAYCASKHAVEAVADALRIELRPWGIRVSNVEPGPIDTSIWRKSGDMAESLVEHIPPERLQLYGRELTMLREAVTQLAGSASPVERVVRAVVHALSARRPKTRYFLGWSVRVCFKGMKMLPDGLRDWIVRKAEGLP
ncbi:MAG: SDR family oxidoreductase [Planctomycetaceae bacterium]|nr:SDR family oxidoreductase [Planctomycetaceae bacterium]